MEACCKTNRKSWLRSISVALFCIILFACDQLTKRYALKNYALFHNINDYIYFKLAFNRGISWGILNSNNKLIFWLITGIIIFVTVLLIIQAYKRYRNSLSILGELLIITGSLSNIVDRFIYGAVIDFIGLHYKDWYFAIFNVADSAIVLGVFILFLRVYYDK